jgi:hypothetical protein
MCEETPNMREEFIPRSRLQDIHFFPNRILLPKAALILSLASRESFAPSTRPKAQTPAITIMHRELHHEPQKALEKENIYHRC